MNEDLIIGIYRLVCGANSCPYDRAVCVELARLYRAAGEPGMSLLWSFGEEEAEDEAENASAIVVDASELPF